MNYKAVICLHLLIVLSLIFVASTTQKERDLNIYPDMHSYGITWMYFPDGDEIPRRISLEMPPSEFLRSSYWVSGEVEYRLYTKYNKQNYVVLNDSAEPVNSTNSRIIENLRKVPIKMITHGWESSGDKSAVLGIKDAYLDTEDVNVIGVDWGTIAESILYPVVAVQTSPVGESVGSFIDALSERYGIPGDSFHLIGHSLGAHVMGNAGAASKLNVSRITGLDPARPLFEVPPIPKSLKLDASDAKFVDIIHTCRFVLGVEDAIGNADFFPNKGNAPQPGCNGPQSLFEACSHSRSHMLFADSVRHPKSYPAYNCSDWNAFTSDKCNVATTFLGENANRTAYGTFFLETNGSMPFGLGYTR